MLSKLASHMIGSRESGAVCFNWTGSTTDIRTETMEIVAEERVSDHPMAINGELVQSSSGLSDPVINPATGEAFDYVPHGTREDLDRAVDAAAEAFKTWSQTPFEERAACVVKFGELVAAKADELAKALTSLEMDASEEAVMQMMQRIDKDSSGTITLDEFSSIVAWQLQLLASGLGSRQSLVAES